ncbi:MAG: molybdopterin molybdotransferase MoeA [Bacteroidia bacterium]|nr:molybdopterin molybdotransferase MoeA [Bacteroidia bacterium]
MISVERAKELVLENCKALGSIKVDLQTSLDHTLFHDLRSPIDLPPFDQSAMDGYALGDSSSYNKGISFEVIAEIQAGDEDLPNLAHEKAARIFTGAPIPPGTKTVIMQEKTTCDENSIELNADIQINENIRTAGEQIKSGEVALKKGHYLNPASIGFLASLGIESFEVYRKPNIAIASTGNELIPIGTDLKHGQIYESNYSALNSAIINTHFAVNDQGKIKDELRKTITAIDDLISENDVVIITGGISVGDHDYVGKALESLGVETIFYKVKQKPGKPMLFGKKDNSLIFALPGNPAAALTCYYEYVLPALRKLSKLPSGFLRKIKLPISHAYTKSDQRAHFLKAKIENAKVVLLDGQSSSMMHTYAHADCLIYLNEETQSVNTGDLVEVHLLP